MSSQSLQTIKGGSMSRTWNETCEEYDRKAQVERRKPSIFVALLEFVDNNKFSRDELRVLGVHAQEILNRREVRADFEAENTLQPHRSAEHPARA